MKPLAELRTEVELGYVVYTHPEQAFVCKDTDIIGRTWYVFWKYWGERERPLQHVDPDGTIICHIFRPEWDSWGIGQPIPIDDCYASFEDLLANWPELTAQPIWYPGERQIHPLKKRRTIFSRIVTTAFRSTRTKKALGSLGKARYRRLLHAVLLRLTGK